MKRILTLVLCLLLVTAMIVPVSAEGSLNISLRAGSTSAYRGDTINFSISVSGGGSCESFGFRLSYDSSVFEYVGGSASVNGALLSSMSSTGLVVSYNGTGSPSGTVANFSLRVKNGAPFGSASVSGSASASGASASGSGVSISVLCNHSYGDWQKYNESNHQKVCGVCGGTKEEGHSWNEGTVVSAPTCKDEGSKTYTCTTCGEIKTEVLSKTEDHKYGAYQKLDDANHTSTCGVCGKVLNEAHTWNAGKVTKQETCKETGIMLYTCTACSATKEETIPLSEVHTFSAWEKVNDQQHTRSCSVCAKQETVDHNWNNGSVTKKPNCIETGTCVYTCKDCGITKTEELPISGVHTYDHGCDKDCNVCKAERSTSHVYSTDWSKDAKEHWHECKECRHKTDVKAHVPGPEATEEAPQLCTVCQYVLKPELTHEHTFTEDYTTDEIGHWYACSGCEEQKDYAEHDFDNGCDDLCETCGYTRVVSHDISEEWYTNAEHHFQKCLSCGMEQEYIRHTAGPAATEMTPQTCEVCGYELVAALGHSFAEDWDYDDLTHFHPCDCGEKADEAEHVWDEGAKADGGKTYTCTVCGFQRFEPRNLSWLLLVVAAVAIAGGVIIFVLNRKRNQKV